MVKLKRDVKKARKAYKEKDVKEMIEAHQHKEIHSTSTGKYIKSWIYGGLDGIITTFAIVAGVAGAGLQSSVILILGFANLIADGISMAIGDYLSSKSEQEYYDLEEKRENWEVKYNPKGEKDEMIQIYTQKGMSKKDAVKMVGLLSKNKKLWVETMMHDELGLLREEGSPVKNGLVTFSSFALFGFVPLILYVLAEIFSFEIGKGFLYTSILAGLAMFALGSMKTKLTGKSWIRSGFETLLIGGVAAASAYFIGHLLASII